MLAVLMNFTAQVRATVSISDVTSPEKRRLSPDDFEFLVDEITDALELSGETGDITVGASLTGGWFEASFSVDAPDIWQGQTKAMRLLEAAQTVAAQAVDRRLATAFMAAHMPRIVSAHVDELVLA
jgi:hypothetical protein